MVDSGQCQWLAERPGPGGGSVWWQRCCVTGGHPPSLVSQSRPAAGGPARPLPLTPQLEAELAGSVKPLTKLLWIHVETECLFS